MTWYSLRKFFEIHPQLVDSSVTTFLDPQFIQGPVETLLDMQITQNDEVGQQDSTTIGGLPPTWPTVSKPLVPECAWFLITLTSKEYRGKQDEHTAMATQFLLNAQVPEKGWGVERRDPKCYPYTTSIVMRALRSVEHKEEFSDKLSSAVSWLTRTRREGGCMNSEGGWGKDPDDEPYESSPAVTAHVLVSLMELDRRFESAPTREAKEKAVNYLRSKITNCQTETLHYYIDSEQIDKEVHLFTTAWAIYSLLNSGLSLLSMNHLHLPDFSILDKVCELLNCQIQNSSNLNYGGFGLSLGDSDEPPMFATSDAVRTLTMVDDYLHSNLDFANALTFAMRIEELQKASEEARNKAIRLLEEWLAEKVRR